MSVFESGDLLISATVIDEDTIDFRKGIRGAGRILHTDSAFQLKNTLHTNKEGLVVGVGVHPTSHTLYVADPHLKAILVFDRYGKALGEVEALPSRAYGAIGFTEDGKVIVGVLTSREPLPDDGHAGSSLFVFDPATGEFEAYAPELDGGRSGWHCISNMSYDLEDGILYYVAEAGHRLSRYDLRNAQQLDDVLVCGKDEERRTYGVGVLPDKRLLLATGIGAQLLDNDGTVLLEYKTSFERGWTRITLPASGQGYFYLNNFLEGVVCKIATEEGAVLDTFDIRNKYSLCGMAEVS